MDARRRRDFRPYDTRRGRALVSRGVHALLILVMTLAAGCINPSQDTGPAAAFAAGLNQPRGMAFDAAGNLYVAETGFHIAAAAGQLTGSPRDDTNHSGRVVRIDPDGHVAALIDNLPYTHYAVSGDTGAADIAIHGDALYLLIGEGYDDELSRTIQRISLAEARRSDAAATPQRLASILLFAIGMSTPTEQVMGTVTSNPYGMTAAPDGQTLYVTDAASGRILRVTLDGAIRVLAELPDMAPLGGLAYGPDGLLYFAMFSFWPHAPGSGEIWAVDPDAPLPATPARVHGELTMPVAVDFDAAGNLYVLEFSAGEIEPQQPAQPYAPHSGRLLQISPDGERTVILDGLHYPTALTFSSTGDLYIAAGGAFSEPGAGEILRLACHTLGAANICPEDQRTRQ